MSTYRQQFQNMCQEGTHVTIHKHGLEYEGTVLLYDRSNIPAFIILEQEDGTKTLIEGTSDTVVSVKPVDNSENDQITEEQEPEQEQEPAVQPKVTPKPNVNSKNQNKKR